MTYSELNEYIKHYLEHDKTGRAIMLTAPWGAGKSHYIKNVLVDYLKDKSTDANRCIIVSLYGLKDLNDISKHVYLEVRAKFLNRKSEKTSAGKIIAKSVVKGIASYFGVDLNISEKDLQKLYESIDLTGKLLIFEDIERSKIDIFDFMGYVNNLTEQDGVKILLVANENELIKCEESDKDLEDDETNMATFDDVEEINKKYTEQTKEYIRIKEKTISDTINFKCDLLSAIKKILLNFGSELSIFTCKDCLVQILELLQESDDSNLRSFIYACQKTKDIFQKGGKLIEKQKLEFKYSIFYGILLYSLKVKNGVNCNWYGDNIFSLTLGSEKYPLYRFCFDYIQNQVFDINKIEETVNKYDYLQLYDTNKCYADKDLMILYSYFTHTENEVKQAIANIEKRLENINEIAFIEYGRIASILVSIGSLIDIDISNCANLMIKNLEGRYKDIDEYLVFSRSLNIIDKNKHQEFADLKQLMIKALNKGKNDIFNFKEYTEKEIIEFCNYAFDKNDYEDILMEAYIRIFRYIDTADTKQDGYNWMCKIVQNAAYDINKKNLPSISLDEISLTLVVGDFRDRIEQRDEIVREICKLSDYEQRLFYLKFYECKSYSQIAEIVKSKKSTVHKQTTAILKKLDKKFD